MSTDVARIRTLLAKYENPNAGLTVPEAEELYRLGCAEQRRSRNFWMLRPLVTLILNQVRQGQTHA